MSKKKLLAAVIACVLGAPTVAQAQPSSHSIYTYQGADREQRLVDGAKKEGKLTLYTSLNVKDANPIIEAFQTKYGIKVDLWRATSEKVVQRGIQEARANRHTVDVFETNGPEMEQLYREKLLSEFDSPTFKDLPAAAIPPHRHYAATRFNFFVMGYNTKHVKPEEVPQSYEDLLHPRWVGKIGIEDGDVDWFGAVVKAMGEEKGLAYFRKLAAMQPQVRHGHTLMAELVAAGEIPLTVTVYNHGIEQLRVKGAPVEWKPLTPTFGRPNAVGVAKNAPNPHAALLFAEFMLSSEGQELIKARKRVPSSRLVNSPLNNFDYQSIDPAIVLDEAKKWEPIWSELFIKGRSAQ